MNTSLVAQTTTVASLSGSSPYCNGGAVTVNYTITGSYLVGNVFTAQLSDDTGSFASPITIGTRSATIGGAISCTLPNNIFVAGTNYTIRVVSSSPVATVTNQSIAFTINPPSFNAPTKPATVCAGATFNVANNVACGFSTGNNFSVQLSDASGSFSSPATIGSINNTTASGNISVTLPQTLSTSSNYRVRIISTNPVQTSPASLPFTINGFGLSAPTTSALYFCQNQSVSVGFSLANTCTLPNSPTNTVTVQLSDAAGSFTSPTTVGTFNGVVSNQSLTVTIPSVPAGTGYRIRTLSSNPSGGLVSPDNGFDITIAAPVGDPTVFGTTNWRCYAYQTNNTANFNATTYRGFYVSSPSLSFNSVGQYPTTSAGHPGLAPTFSGCNNMNPAAPWGVAYKRTNFTCGYYTLTMARLFGNADILINNKLVASLNSDPAAQPGWTGFLSPSSIIEIRYTSNGAPATNTIVWNLVSGSLPISPYNTVTQCASATSPVSFTASAPISSALTPASVTYAWTPTNGLTPADGLGATITAAPSSTTVYTVTGTDAITGCTATAPVRVNISATQPPATITVTPASYICNGLTSTQLSGPAGVVNYTWSPLTGLRDSVTGLAPTNLSKAVIARPTTTTTYTLTTDNGCTTPTPNSQTQVVTVENVANPIPGFGTGQWDVAVYQGGGSSLAGGVAPGGPYFGKYSTTPSASLNVNTATIWSSFPGNNAPGYQGCKTDKTFVEVLKRTGFDCRYYVLDFQNYSPAVSVYVNGNRVYSNHFGSASPTNAWAGFLSPTSTVEIRHYNNGGNSALLRFTFTPTGPQVISPNVTICPGTSTNLTATSSIPGVTYAWSISPVEPTITFSNGLNVANTTLQTTALTPSRTYTMTNVMTDALGTGCTSTVSNVVTVSATSVTAVTPLSATTSCPTSSSFTLTASGANTYSWSPSTGLSATTGHQVIASPVVTTTYTVTGDNNCTTSQANTTITIVPLPTVGTFPTNTWNVYGFNSTTVGTNYSGYYTENGSGSSGYNFDTQARWSAISGPSAANSNNGFPWQGCAFPTTNVSLSFKRSGFNCGIYRIDIPAFGNQFALLINGVQVAAKSTPGNLSSVWTGVLSSSTQVEFRLVLTNNTNSQLSVTFTPISQPVGTNIWHGGVDTDWSTASNWCLNSVPLSTTHVLIPQGVLNNPTISVGAEARNITINSGVASSTFTSALAAGNLTIVGVNNLNVYGNWANNGTFTSSTGTVTFRNIGSSVNVITSSGTETFSNITINNPNGVLMTSGVHEISNQLTLSAGVLTNSSTLNILNGASVSGSSNSSYVDGRITKIGNQAFVFPTGNGGFYKPIAISAPSSVGSSFTAQYFFTSPTPLYPISQVDPTLLFANGIDYWFLEGSGSVSTTLSWGANNIGIGLLPDLRVARWNSTTSRWQDHGNGGTTGTIAAGTIISAGPINSFNTAFALATVSLGNPLPVTISRFECFKTELGTIRIEWEIASEKNNDYFVVERSQNGEEFTEIARVKTLSKPTTYRVDDPSPKVGTNYYRLKQVDYDGTFTYSKVISADTDQVNQANFYPNPATKGVINFYVANLLPHENYRITLQTLQGSNAIDYAVSADDNGTVSKSLDCSNVVNGIYLLKLNSKLVGRIAIFN